MKAPRIKSKKRQIIDIIWWSIAMQILWFFLAWIITWIIYIIIDLYNKISTDFIPWLKTFFGIVWHMIWTISTLHWIIYIIFSLLMFVWMYKEWFFKLQNPK